MAGKLWWRGDWWCRNPCGGEIESNRGRTNRYSTVPGSSSRLGGGGLSSGERVRPSWLGWVAGGPFRRSTGRGGDRSEQVRRFRLRCPSRCSLSPFPQILKLTLGARTPPDTPQATKLKLKQRVLLRMVELMVKGEMRRRKKGRGGEGRGGIGGGRGRLLSTSKHALEYCRGRGGCCGCLSSGLGRLIAPRAESAGGRLGIRLSVSSSCSALMVWAPG